jgi:hypothetical protein
MLKDALYFCPNFTGYDNTLKGNTANFQATQEQSWLPPHQSSGLHSKGTAATNVDRHMQKLSHTRQTRQSWERRRRGQIRHSMNRQSTPGQSTQSVTGGRQKLWNARGQKCRNHTCGAAERNRNQRLIHSM